ncbi:hypothetical protein BDW02DRAFT_603717, partial [Decorospora gaudefroyi]
MASASFHLQKGPDITTIAGATIACREGLERCMTIESLKRQGWAENRLADFNVWDSGLGACSNRRASLEDRLALKPQVRAAVLNLLVLYKHSIDICIDFGLLHDERGNFNFGGELSNDTSVDDSEHISTGLTNDEELTIDDATLPEAIENADLVLNDLARLAVLIRKAGTTSRLYKADKTFDPRAQKHKELRDHLYQLLLAQPSLLEGRRHEHWDNIDPSLVGISSEEKNAYWARVDQDTIEFLHDDRAITEVQTRLVVANLRRSHRFAYSQRHGRKLESSSQQPNISANTNEQSKIGSSIETPLAKWDMPSGPKTNGSIQGDPLYGAQSVTLDYAAKTMADTVASDVDTIIIANIAKLPTPSQQAVTEISTTGSRLRYPKPPRCKEGAALFNCPCCCVPLPIIFADPRRWRKHLKEDILPYTCVLPNCPHPDTTFAEKTAWMEHMFNDHVVSTSWECDICGNTETFPCESVFVTHLTDIHLGAIPADQMELFVEMGLKQTVEEISSCPLCSWAQDAEGVVSNDQLLEHVAEHIHSFALRSLPWAPDKNEENQATFKHAFEKVEEWFAKCYPDAETFGYKPSPRAMESKKDPDDYFHTHEYFAESSRESSLAPTLSSIRTDDDEYDESHVTPAAPSILIPFARDADFVERGTTLDQVDRICAAPDARAALVGLGGVGKSQLAIEHAYRTHKQSPETWVFWVHASNAARFKQSFRDIANRVKIAGRQSPQANIFQLVHDWLCDCKQDWLIVLDNVDDARFLLITQATDSKTVSRPLHEYIPHCERGSILVTTRNKEAARKLVEQRDIICVEPMNKAEGRALFEKKLEAHKDNSNIADLAAALEYMPLAIVQAAAYILQRAPRCSVAKYLDEYRKSERKQISLLNRDGAVLRRDREAKNSILVTWQISFEYIQQIRSSAADLLSLMSFFDRQGIPEDLLRPRTERQEEQTNQTEKVRDDGDSDSEDDTSQSSVGDEQFEDDIIVLRNFCFISVDTSGTSFEMHALVQLATRMWLETNSKLEQWKEQFVSNLFSAFPTGRYENWAACQVLYAHAKAAVGQQPRDESSIAEWATVLYCAAWFAQRIGDIADAEMLATKAMEARTKVLGQEHEDTLWSVAMIGLAYKLRGRWNEAEKLEVQVVETRKKKLGADHPDTLTSMANLAAT